MKAICIVEPGRVEIRDIEKPVRKPGEALLKLLYGGICGSDLGSYRGGNAYAVSYTHLDVYKRQHQTTSDLMAEVIRWLKVKLAPVISIHGVLVDVFGEGVLIMGESGIGKSEAALELIKRGHRLVSDDVVEIDVYKRQAWAWSRLCHAPSLRL